MESQNQGCDYDWCILYIFTLPKNIWSGYLLKLSKRNERYGIDWLKSENKQRSFHLRLITYEKYRDNVPYECCHFFTSEGEVVEFELHMCYLGGCSSINTH